MRLTVRDAAGILNVSEKTIYRWIRQGKIPTYRVSDQYRFNRSELLEWATSQKLNVSPDLFVESEGSQSPLPTLSEALKTGGISYRVDGQDKPSVLKAVVDLMPHLDAADRQMLLQVMLARESLGSTGIGDGIAIPHVRNPVVVNVSRPIVSLCFLERPIEFGALDGRPVHILFTLISPTVRDHLHLLSKLAFVLRNQSVKNALLQQAPREEIFAGIERVEQQLLAAPVEAAPESVQKES